MADETDTRRLTDFNSAPRLLQRATANFALLAIRDIGPDIRLADLSDDEILQLVRGVIQSVREPIEEAAVFISSSAAGAEYTSIQENLSKRLSELLEDQDTNAERRA